MEKNLSTGVEIFPADIIIIIPFFLSLSLSVLSGDVMYKSGRGER